MILGGAFSQDLCVIPIDRAAFVKGTKHNHIIILKGSHQYLNTTTVGWNLSYSEITCKRSVLMM